MKASIHPEPALRRENAVPHCASRSSSATADAALEFGRFRVLLRRRQLLADGVPVELGTRAFDLLVVLLEADGLLVSKDELFSRVWPGIVVSEENLKVQVSALSRALGADRDVIRTEFRRGSDSPACCARMLRRTGVNAWREQSCGLPPPFPPPQVGEGWVGGHGTVGNRSGAVSVRASASIPAI